ncbi:MAG: alpha/beta hydrolase, partial [Gemmatimonadetes bacterium]|nr:alpha/beta hydrolase [Gemmatimonadota bacterium]
LNGPGGWLRAREYVPPDTTDDLGTLVYFHGGGWVMGNLDTHDALCRGLTNAAGVRVVAIEYRLAPEHPHPAAIEDAWAATAWARERWKGPLAVGGDSAGGHLAITVAATAKTRGLSLAAQVLIYPVTDLSNLDTESYETFAEGYWLTRDAMVWFRDHLLPEGHPPTDPMVSPLLRPDVSGMAPAIVVLAECDVLRDEGYAYARRLEAAGGLSACLEFSGVIHGFVAMPQAIAEGRRALEQIGQALAPLMDPSS